MGKRKASVSPRILKDGNTRTAIINLNREIADKIRFLADCINDPLSFGREVLGSIYQPYQEVVLNALVTNDRVAWRAAHGVGKSYTAADAVLWWLFTRPESVVVTTASVYRQVEKILWAEIRSKANKMNLDKIGWDQETWPFDILTTMIKIADKWFATGESSDKPEKMEGFHSEHILYVVDEAKAVKHETFAAIEGALTTAGAKLMVISTPPLAPEGYFYEIWTDPKKTDRWQKFHTSAFESNLVSKQWIEEKKIEWGVENPVYISKVLGDFPTKTIDTLIPLNLIEAATLADLPPGESYEMAVDVARFGDDESILMERKGFKVDYIDIYETNDLVYLSGKIINYQKAKLHQAVKIDADGLGAGVYDIVRDQIGNTAVEIRSGISANNPDKYFNRRAEMYDMLKQIFETGVDIPDDPKLVAQLANIKYKYTPKGQLQVESKEEMKKRGLPSPDRADCLAYLFSDQALNMPEVRIRRL
jgi:phage terminase large subunit